MDERIEKAIVQTGAKLMILDPMQGYLGDKIDMNRANEIRTVLKNVAAVAERTGCAIVLVGHLNKASGMSSAYRGLGSIDFRASVSLSRVHPRGQKRSFLFPKKRWKN